MWIDSFSGYVAEKFKNTKMPRSQIYNAALVYSYFKYKPVPLEFTYNDKTYNAKYMLLAICNGKYYGNGYMVSPNAKIDSGSFDVYFVYKTLKPLLLGLISQMRKGTHINSKFFGTDKSKSLHLKSNCDLICNIDGELSVGKEFDISIIEKGIKIFNDREFIDSFSKFKKK
jgi:diacylglycerol kinase family enzyme